MNWLALIWDAGKYLLSALVLNEAKNGVVALSIRLRAHTPFGECNWRREHAGLCPKIRWYLIVAPESLQAPDMRGQNLSRPSSTISRVAEPMLNPKCPKIRQDTVRTSKIGPLSLDCPSLINCLKRWTRRLTPYYSMPALFSKFRNRHSIKSRKKRKRKRKI